MIKDNKILIDGRCLEAVWHGPMPGEALTLILLHEGLGCVAMWKDFPQALSEATGCGVLVYSRWGYGRSDGRPAPWPLTYMHEAGLEELPQVIETLGIKEHVLIGHSDGGSVTLINAGGIQNPYLKGIITEAAHVFNEQLCHDSIQQTKRDYESGKLRPPLARYHGDHVDDTFWGWCDSWLNDAWWQWNLEDFLPKIQVPALIIQGWDDPYGTKAQVDAIAAQIGGPHEVLMLPDCLHTPHREQRQMTLEAMTNFVTELQ